jgi:hypothetical protein
VASAQHVVSLLNDQWPQWSNAHVLVPPRRLSENMTLERVASLMGFRKTLNYPDTKFQLAKTCTVLTLAFVYGGLIPFIFAYIAGFIVKFPNTGRINPVTMALAIFLKLCAAQTIENSPATFSLPRTLKPRNPLFLI